MPTAHLLSGLPCSGKSTFASSLVEENGGVLFSLDYWLITLHGRYSLEDIGYNEHVRRVLACRQIISGVACEFLRHGLDVVLDDGFFSPNIEYSRLPRSSQRSPIQMPPTAYAS
jgi:predicted kinase